MSNPRIKGIPEPKGDFASLQNTAQATKEAVEVLAGHRGSAVTRAVTFQDLIDMGVIQADQIPK